MQARTVLLSAQWEDYPLVREQVRSNVEEVSTTGDRKRADPIACRLDRGRTEASPKQWRGSARAGRNRSLERASPPAATRSWEAASDVGLELRTNVWLQPVASVPSLRPGLSRSGRPRASPSHRDFPRSGSWTVLCSATCRQRNAAQCGR